MGWQEDPVVGVLDEDVQVAAQKNLAAAQKVAETLSRNPDVGVGEQAAAYAVPAYMRDIVADAVRQQYRRDQSSQKIGYTGRLTTSLVRGGVDFAYPLAKLTGAVPSLTPSQEQFAQQLASIRTGEDPLIREDTNVLGRAVQQVGQMAMPMASSIAAGSTLGGAAMAAGAAPTSLAVGAATAAGTSGSFLPQIADDTYKQLIVEGHDPQTAKWITAVSAPLEAAVESLLPNPFKAKSGLFRGATSQIAKNFAMEWGKRYGMELAEEGIQGALRQSAMEVGRLLDSQIPNQGLGSVLMAGLQSMQESALPLALMMAPAGAQLTGQAVVERRVAKQQSLEQEAAYRQRIEQAVQQAHERVNEPPPVQRSLPQPVIDELATQREQAARPVQAPVTEQQIAPGVQAQLDEIRAKRAAGEWAADHPGQVPSRRQWSGFGLRERLPRQERAEAAAEYAGQVDQFKQEEEDLLAEMGKVGEKGAATVPEALQQFSDQIQEGDSALLYFRDGRSTETVNLDQGKGLAEQLAAEYQLQDIEAIDVYFRDEKKRPLNFDMDTLKSEAYPEWPSMEEPTPAEAPSVPAVEPQAEVAPETQEQPEAVLEAPAKPEELVQRHMDLLEPIARSHVQPGVEYDDLYQEAFLALQRAATVFQPRAGSDFTRYANRSIARRLNTYLRRQGKALPQLTPEQEQVLEPVAPAPAEESELSDQELLGRLEAAVQELPAEQQQLLQRHLRSGRKQSLRELAQQAGISGEAMRKREQRLFAELRKKLAGKPQPAPAAPVEPPQQKGMKSQLVSDDWKAEVEKAVAPLKIGTATTLDKLYAETVARHPDLTLERFKAGMLEMHEAGRLQLDDYTRAWADVFNKPEVIRGKDYDEKRGYGLKWFVRGPRAEAPAAPVEQQPPPPRSQQKAGRKPQQKAMKAQPAGAGTGTPSQPGMPVAMRGTGEKIGAREVIEQLEQTFQVPIRAGRLRGKDLRGVYKTVWQNVRVKGQESASIDVASHEIAHALDDKTDILSSAPLAARQEVSSLDYDPNQLRTDEGFAEFVRGYLTEDIDVQQRTPQFFAHFTQWLDQHPREAQQFSAAHSLITRWRLAGAPGRVKGQISDSGKPVSQPLREQAPYLIHKTYQALKDQFHFGHLFEKELRERGYQPSVGESFMDKAVALNQSGATLANTALESGVFSFDANGNIQRIGNSLWKALEPITTQEYDDWRAWAYARHALEAWQQGKNPGITQEDAQAVYDLGRQNRHWEQAADALTQFNKDLVQVMVDVGRISPETGQLIQDAYSTYVPLFRVVPKKAGLGGQWNGVKLVDLPTPFKRRKGSGYQILDPVQSTVRQAMVTYQLATAQVVTNEMVNAAKQHDANGWIEKLPPNLQVTNVQLNEVWKAMQDQMAAAGMSQLDIQAIEDTLDQGTQQQWRSDLVAIFRPNYFNQGGQPIVRIYENGQPTLYYMNQDLYQTVTGMGLYQMPYLLDKTLGAVTRLVRTGATTLNPTFVARNFLRDMPTYLVQRDFGGKVDPMHWITTYAYSEFQRRIKGHREDPFVRLWRQYGGQLSSVLAPDRASVRRAVQSAVKGKQKFGLIENIMDAAQFTEAGPRLAEFVGVWKQHGYSKADVQQMVDTGNIPADVLIQALNAAHEVTVDFRRAGTVGKVFTRLIPFWNARLEGLDKSIRTWKDNPARTFMRYMGYAVIPSILYWLWHKDEDWYQERESWLDAYWILTDEAGKPIGRIPRGHEVAQVGAGVEAILDSLYRHDPESLTKWAAQFWKQTRPEFNVSVLSTAWQLGTNTDVFGRPIVPRGKQELQPADQAKEYNTHLMKAIGKWLNMSPAKLEYAFNSVTGGLYRRAAVPVESAVIEGKPPTLPDLPVIEGFSFRAEQARSVDEFYTEASRISQAYLSSRLPGRETAAELTADNYKFSRISDMMSDLRKLTAGISDRDTRWESDQYLAGLARLALGREELPRFPNPLNPKNKLPEKVQAIIADHVGRLAATASSLENPATATQEKVEQQERAVQLLKDLGVSANQASSLLLDRLLNQGVKREGRVNRVKRLTLQLGD